MRPYLNVYRNWKAKGPIRYINHRKASNIFVKGIIKQLDEKFFNKEVKEVEE